MAPASCKILLLEAALCLRPFSESFRNEVHGCLGHPGVDTVYNLIVYATALLIDALVICMTQMLQCLYRAGCDRLWKAGSR